MNSTQKGLSVTNMLRLVGWISAAFLLSLHLCEPQVVLPGGRNSGLSDQIPPDDQSAAIWAYFLRKYSSSSSHKIEQPYLSGSDVQRLVSNLQKCDSSNSNSILDSNLEDIRLGEYPPTETQPDNSFCTLYNPQLVNISSLGQLNQICSQILYVVDNADCCGPVPPPRNEALASQLQPNAAVAAPTSTSDGSGKDGREPSARITPSTEKPTAGEVWGFGFLFVTIISACSVVGVSVLPVMGKKAYKYILTTMIGLAVGSLTGSAVFHLMPSAFKMSAHDPHHDYLFTSLVVTGGIWMFFMVERILKLIMDHKDRIDTEKNPWKKPKKSINYSTPESNTNSILAADNGGARQTHSPENGAPPSHTHTHTANNCSSRETEFIYETQEQAIKASFGHQDKPKTHGHDHMLRFEQGKDSVIATVAWMIIFGDGLHNFIDGLSIGAALNESILTGVSISVAVFCEELPHELRDFAVLLNAGMTMRQALVYNFLSACTCYLGMAVGIFLGEVEASSYIFAVATGMFLYIALVDMVPEMNEVAEKASKVSVRKGLFVLFIQNIGILIGIFALFILAKYQDNIKF